LPPCFFYNDIGKLQVTLECCESIGAALSEEQRNLVDWFHNFIFTETLQFRAGALSKNGCRVVLLHEGRQSVNFEQMQQLQMNSSKRDGKFSSDINLSDSVVIEGYLRSAGQQSPGHYMVISAHGTQLRAVHHTRKLDCRRSRDYTGAAGKSRILVRDPKCLEFYKSPQSLTFRALFLPAILYRVDSLVSIIQLQNTISTGMADCAACDVPEIPRKRLRTSSSQTSRTPSTLEQYFCAFDISKKIPVFQLLEAVTCASSADDFNLERLEMLGDSFLKMAVSIHVYWHKDHKDEGKLTKYRVRQISNKNLFNLAMKKDLPKYIKYSTFSKETWRPPGFTTPHRPSSHDVTFDAEVNRDDVITQKIPDKSVADSMEALIGAHFMHCGYIGALRFMNWLGVDVFYDEHTNDGGELTNGNRRKSPTPRCPSKYANYPVASFDVPVGEESARYEEILEKQTKIMASFEKMIGYSFKNKVCSSVL
jgi:dsRNA-specific ribonuclease